MTEEIHKTRGALTALLAIGTISAAIAGCGGGSSGSTSTGSGASSPATSSSTQSAPASAPAAANCKRDADGDKVEPTGNDGDGCGV